LQWGGGVYGSRRRIPSSAPIREAGAAVRSGRRQGSPAQGVAVHLGKVVRLDGFLYLLTRDSGERLRVER
jgi:hypothetical protein